MHAIFMMLWLGEDTPDNFFDLAVHLQGAPARIAEWKSSIAQEEAHQAWASLKTHFPGLDLTSVVTTNPKMPDDHEVPSETFFDAVMEFARLTEQDCTLEQIIE